MDESSRRIIANTRRALAEVEPLINRLTEAEFKALCQLANAIPPAQLNVFIRLSTRAMINGREERPGDNESPRGESG